jgi:hypothetical protein
VAAIAKPEHIRNSAVQAATLEAGRFSMSVKLRFFKYLPSVDVIEPPRKGSPLKIHLKKYYA